MTTTAARRVIAIEDHYRRAGPHGRPDAVAAALDWAMSLEDRATWRALVARYETRLGTHPATVDPGDLDPGDLEAMEDVFRRAYIRLGWPIHPDAA